MRREGFFGTVHRRYRHSPELAIAGRHMSRDALADCLPMRLMSAAARCFFVFRCHVRRQYPAFDPYDRARFTVSEAARLADEDVRMPACQGRRLHAGQPGRCTERERHALRSMRVCERYAVADVGNACEARAENFAVVCDGSCNAAGLVRYSSSTCGVLRLAEGWALLAARRRGALHPCLRQSPALMICRDVDAGLPFPLVEKVADPQRSGGPVG